MFLFLNAARKHAQVTQVTAVTPRGVSEGSAGDVVRFTWEDKSLSGSVCEQEKNVEFFRSGF